METWLAAAAQTWHMPSYANMYVRLAKFQCVKSNYVAGLYSKRLEFLNLHNIIRRPSYQSISFKHRLPKSPNPNPLCQLLIYLSPFKSGHPNVGTQQNRPLQHKIYPLSLCSAHECGTLQCLCVVLVTSLVSFSAWSGYKMHTQTTRRVHQMPLTSMPHNIHRGLLSKREAMLV